MFGKEGLCGDEAFAELEVGSGEFGFGDDLFEGAEDGDGVHVVEEADVGDAEELTLHLSWPSVTMAPNCDLRPLTSVPESEPSGATIAVAAAAS